MIERHLNRDGSFGEIQSPALALIFTVLKDGRFLTPTRGHEPFLQKIIDRSREAHLPSLKREVLCFKIAIAEPSYSGLDLLIYGQKLRLSQDCLTVPIGMCYETHFAFDQY